MSKSYYLLLNTSKLERTVIQSILDKFCNPYNDGELFHKEVYIGDYLLACNSEKENHLNMMNNNNIHMVSRGSNCSDLCAIFDVVSKSDVFDVTEISEVLSKRTNNFSFIAIGKTDGVVMATDPNGMEKIYIGYKDSIPVLFTNYNIDIYFKQIYNFSSISCIKDGYIRIDKKSSSVYQSFMKDVKDNIKKGIMGGLDLFSPNQSPLDAIFTPLIGTGQSENMFDYETRKGKYGTSILDRMICWTDTQERFVSFSKPPKSISMYEDKQFFEYESSSSYSTKIQVIQQDWIDQAIAMKKSGLNPVVLNMTDRFFPACNIQQGASSQEETIFRRSNYAQTLIVDLYPFNTDNRVIYSPDVTFFKSSEQTGWVPLEPVEKICLMACPPVKSPYNLTYDYTNLFEYAELNPDHTMITKKYLEIVFQSAIRLKHDCLILPAFGCEGHKNPPRHIAKIIKELYKKYYGYLKSIFIVMPDIDQRRLGNYMIFKDVIETEPIIETNTAIIDSDKLLNDVLSEE